MAQLRLSAEAERDLISIWQYSADNWGEPQADRYLDLLDAAMRTLESNPDPGLDVGALKTGYRRIRAERHVVYYRREGDDVVIIRILHERMDAARHL